MGALNASGQTCSEYQFLKIKEYIMSQKRTVKYNGTVNSEIATCSKNDIIRLTDNFPEPIISITTSAMSPGADDLRVQFVHQWAKEKVKIMFLKLDEDDNVVSFAILHRTDFDPLKTQRVPHIVDYLYTYPDFRSKGHATALLNELKKHYECSAFCTTDVSLAIFQKSGFVQSPFMMGLHLLRYPPVYRKHV